jgi:hypothetical protein
MLQNSKRASPGECEPADTPLASKKSKTRYMSYVLDMVYSEYSVLCSVTSYYSINLIFSDDMDGANDIENDGGSGKWF